MRRSTIGWLGTGLAASLALAAQGACGSGGTGGSANAGGGTSTGASTGNASGSTSSGSTSSGTGGSSSSTGSSAASSSSSGGMVGDSVLMHHKNPTRDGVYVQPALTKTAVATLHRDTSFAATVVQGNVYAQPLFIDGGAGGQDLVIVATTSNNVYGLDAATGAQVWTRTLGPSVPLVSLPCGNIDPLGVIGTPVVDFASRTLYLDAEITPDGGATKQHRVFALSIDDGSTRSGWPVDMAAKAKSGSTTFDPSVQGQRGALALVNGTVYVPFGGRFGDCGTYHGWVVGIETADPSKVQAWATTANAGGIWAPNGIATDGVDLFVSTGNTFAAGNVWAAATR